MKLVAAAIVAGSAIIGAALYLGLRHQFAVTPVTGGFVVIDGRARDAKVCTTTRVSSYEIEAECITSILSRF